MRKNAGAFARAVAIAGTGIFCATAAMAEYELYSDSEGTTKILFNIDVIGVWYASTDSWFGQSEPFLGANTDNWADLGAEPSVSLEMPLASGTFFGQVSGVYTSTAGDDASGLTVGLEDTAELTLEQGHIGWRTEDPFDGLEGDTFTVTLGRQDYNIGTGLLINDGGGDGGERGGWYLGMRKTFSESLILSLDSDSWLIEGFTLKNRPRGGGTQGDAYGANVEYTFGEATTFGATYLQADANLPGIDQADVVSGRIDWQATNGFGLSGEYVDESSSQISATGYYGQISYELQDARWSPVLSYRYAHFDGDDPNTPEDERFREIAYGFTDWGTWYQGEITGEYVFGNGNLISHLVRVKTQPREGLTLNLMYYKFTLDQPASIGVTHDDWGDELNFTVDWEVSEQIYLIGVVGMLFPGEGAEQFVGASGDDWLHSMLYIMYSW
jgi:hypothetical protein